MVPPGSNVEADVVRVRLDGSVAAEGSEVDPDDYHDLTRPHPFNCDVAVF